MVARRRRSQAVVIVVIVVALVVGVVSFVAESTGVPAQGASVEPTTSGPGAPGTSDRGGPDGRGRGSGSVGS